VHRNGDHGPGEDGNTGYGRHDHRETNTKVPAGAVAHGSE
jgi:hypothetical protein